ncbi:hypothetical protein BJX68DRAFT_267588 [Aspergillus pseudodeflectus]|uniref:Uncharacterized protein n=1 Tax=Aspergillus pseudodeflectus TaxID=176178 RepID=A0ABR4K9P1_9EURO
MSHQSSATRTEEKPQTQNEGQLKIQNDTKPMRVPSVILTAPNGETHRATRKTCHIYYRQNCRELFNQLHRTQWKQRRKIEEVQREVAMERSHRKRKAEEFERELAKERHEKKRLERKLVKEQAERRQVKADLAKERNNVHRLEAFGPARPAEVMQLLRELRAIKWEAKMKKLLEGRPSLKPTSCEN